MSNPEINLTVVRVDRDIDPHEEYTQRLKIARFKTQGVLAAWRSRFTDTNVTAHYSLPSGEMVTISSSMPMQADVAVHYPDDSRQSYMLDALHAGHDEPILQRHNHSSTGHRLPPTGDEADWHASLASILYECDALQTGD